MYSCAKHFSFLNLKKKKTWNIAWWIHFYVKRDRRRACQIKAARFYFNKPLFHFQFNTEPNYFGFLYTKDTFN